MAFTGKEGVNTFFTMPFQHASSSKAILCCPKEDQGSDEAPYERYSFAIYPNYCSKGILMISVSMDLYP